MKSRNKLFRNLMILSIMAIIITVIVIKDDFGGILNVLLAVNVYYLLLAMLLIIGWLVFMALALKVLANLFSPGFTFKKTFNGILLTNFMANITPGSAGGHPATIYALYNQGLKGSEATHIAFIYFMIYQVAFILLTSIAIIGNFFFDYFQDDGLLKVIIAICYWLNILFLIMLFVITFNRRINKWIFSKGIKWLNKLKIIKDPKTLKAKWHIYIDEFINCGVVLKQEYPKLLISLAYYLIALLMFMSIPYVIIKSLDASININFMVSAIAALYVCLIATFIPSPGSSGGVEAAFAFFYGKFIFDSSTLAATLLLYRGITFYLIIIIGGFSLFRFSNLLWKTN